MTELEAKVATLEAQLRSTQEEVAKHAQRASEAEERAHYADANATAFTQAFCETAEAAIAHADAPRGGQHVPFHGDFHNLPPSALGRLRWWAKCGRAALKGDVSTLLVRARNEGIERIAAERDAEATNARDKATRYVGQPIGREWARVAETLEAEAHRIRAMKEPES